MTDKAINEELEQKFRALEKLQDRQNRVKGSLIDSKTFGKGNFPIKKFDCCITCFGPEHKKIVVEGSL